MSVLNLLVGVFALYTAHAPGVAPWLATINETLGILNIALAVRR